MKKILTLGESLARLSTQRGNRLSDSTLLHLHYGGAESNVAINLALLDHEVKYATKLPSDNGLVESLISSLRAPGVDCSQILYGEGRLGSYYLEVGTGFRASNIVYDRKYSTISLMKENEWDLDELFKDVSLFHITGITVALSPVWRKIGVELIQEAKKRGIKVSFDMNYRQKMWSYEEATETYQQILPNVDYLSAGKLDAIHFVGVPEKEEADWAYYLKGISEKYPNIKYLYGTIRETLNANTYEMKGYIWDGEKQEGAISEQYNNYMVVDRVGSGDSYTAAVLDGIIYKRPLLEIVEFGMSAAALKHTVYGDINPFTRKEIESFGVNSGDVIR